MAYRKRMGKSASRRQFKRGQGKHPLNLNSAALAMRGGVRL